MSVARARLTVDLNAVAANYAVFRRLAGAAEVGPVVKADAYGLGMIPVSLRLWAEGARSFFVARLEEGEALRDALGPARPAAIHVFDGAPPGSAARLLAADLAPVLSSPAQVEIFAALARNRPQPAPCSLHIDTGMNRLGLRLEEIAALAAASDRLQGLDVQLLISHLACADQEEHRMNARQEGRLRQALAAMPGVRASLANSAGAFLGPAYLHQMVRPGIGLYGGGPFGRPHPDIAPVAAFTAPILQVRTVSAGETVGYGADFQADRALRVAIVAAGYADGVPRSAASQGRAWFSGEDRRLLGRISMDLLAIDVTGCDDAQPGAMVELFGPNLPVDEAARAAGTIAYEILTRVAPRVERAYVGAVAN